MVTDLLLQQFAREPRAGAVKTRMQPTLTAEQACELHCELVQWTCRQLVESGLGDVELCVAGSIDHAVFDACRELGVASVVAQSGADLGERMYDALARGLESHAGVILVGSDCPAISPAYLALARDAMSRVPVVLGPAEDGGYVLIGVRKVYRDLFADVAWGTERVLAQSLDRLRARQLGCETLPPLPDIDRPEDLAHWHAVRDGVW